MMNRKISDEQRACEKIFKAENEMQHRREYTMALEYSRGIQGLAPGRG
jgi:hypothetical protein